MKLVVLAAIVFVVVFLFLLCGRHHIEHFFGNDNVTVSWTAPSVPNPSTLAYQWTVCAASVGTCGTPGSGSSWSPPATTSSTSVGLNSTNCVGCEFGGDFSFAVRSVDTSSQLTSGWSSTNIVLTQTAGGSAVVTDNSGVPLTSGSDTFRYVATVGYASTPPSPSDLVTQLQVTLTRGSTVYTDAPTLAAANAGGPGNQYSYIGQGSFLGGSWSPSAPGDLQVGDQIAFTGLVVSNQPVSAGTSTPVYFFATQNVDITAVAPGVPSALSFVVSA